MVGIILSCFFMIPNICCFCVTQFLIIPATVFRLLLWIIFPIMIHRLRLTNDVITKDMSLIKSYAAFGSHCGDQYAVLDVTTIKENLDEAVILVNNALVICWIVQLYLVIEFLVPIMCIVPATKVSFDDIKSNWLLFWGCKEFGQFMNISLLKS